ncbi:hypothetical protein CSV86_017760 [Pseudomonas putida CSV86]|uniref:Lipoprotein n=2 Tax=Pseudomonas TaxID=286 RepID=A0A177SSJ9_PSEPU|nr:MULTISPECIES: hypothetical protein [Pseudomonas]MDG9881611.1 hypothetical protein [Pseudomonas sp. GD04058]NNJ16913.1 hypothetical protein [Pseudomonas bharatica CSV86]OAI93952.1 hypothetical protein AYO28_10700 [Pseudomonas putida]
MRLTSILLYCVASLATAQADDLQPRVIAPVPGAPGTATPTPYPQITPSMPPKAGDGRPGGPLLPPMPLPSPPKDQPLPGLMPTPDKTMDKTKD